MTDRELMQQAVEALHTRKRIMDRNYIITLAREAGCIGPDEGGDPNGLWEPQGHENVTELMMTFAAFVAAAEREACVKLFKGKEGLWDAEGIVYTIRARGEK